MYLHRRIAANARYFVYIPFSRPVLYVKVVYKQGRGQDMYTHPLKNIRGCLKTAPFFLYFL